MMEVTSVPSRRQYVKSVGPSDHVGDCFAMLQDGQDENYVEGARGTVAEQNDESHFDDRLDADDDIEKGYIKMPKDKIYGRDQELMRLWQSYQGIATHCKMQVSLSDGNDIIPSDVSQTLPVPQIFSTNEISNDSLIYFTPCASPSRVVFLGGYSGIGKSTLVTEFIKQVTDSEKQVGPKILPPLLPACGKYIRFKSTAAPYLAIAEAFQRLISTLVNAHNEGKANQSTSVLSKIRTGILTSESIGPATEGCQVLQTTLPGLRPLFSGVCKNGAYADPSSNVEVSSDEVGGISHHQKVDQSFNIGGFKQYFRELVAVICNSVDHIFLLFLDDLQWIDEPSVEILLCLLSDDSLNKFMAICAYRSNEVHRDHPFQLLMNAVKKSRGYNHEKPHVGTVDCIELFSLSPRVVDQFIADTTKRECVQDVSSLSEVIYYKTMGNIFYIIQSIEELVRKNALYYDLVDFEWKWCVSRVTLENYLSDDVINTVKLKIQGLPKIIQKILIVMAYVHNAVDTLTLQELLVGGELEVTAREMPKLLKRAISEGMLVQTTTGMYSFAHDRIQEASYEMVYGSARDELTTRISEVLIERGSLCPRYEWMLYVAVDHLNLVPPELFRRIHLAKLNLLVAKITRSKYINAKANQLLRSGLACLEASGEKWKDYDFTLDLYNNIIMSEYSLGHFDEAKLAINEVIKHAKSPQERFTAYSYKILCVGYGKDPNYELGVQEGIKILNVYGHKMPLSPTKAEIMKESLQLKLALRNRTLLSLSDLPLVKNDSMFHMFYKVMHYSLLSANHNLGSLIYHKAIRLAIREGICHYVPAIIACHARALVRSGDLKSGFTLGKAAAKLSEKFPHGENNGLTRLNLYAGILPHFLPFRESCDVLYASYNSLKFSGNNELALACGFSSVACGLASGLPLNRSLISNMAQLEEYASISGKISFASLFQILRNFTMNLIKDSDNQTNFVGEVFDEVKALDKMDGEHRSMAHHDCSMYRLELAFIYWDEVCMEEMLARLTSYPKTDLSASRMHTRLCFIGLSAFYLEHTKNAKSYLKIGEASMDFFEALVKLGSLSARPVYLFLEAMKNPSRQAFDKAIASCAEFNLLHLEAMANERCGVFCSKQDNNQALAKAYITKAFWLYHDWGALAKTKLMSTNYLFLKRARRNKFTDK